MTIYRHGIAQPEPDPIVVDVLRRHEWDHRLHGCYCGWTQLASNGRAGARLNHPVHVATAIAAAVTVPAEPSCNHDPAALDVVELSQCECGAIVDTDTGAELRLG